MELLRENTEIQDQQHLMHAEGTSDQEPTQFDVEQHLGQEGWFCDDIDIWFDNFQSVWRWNCGITRP